MRLAVRDYLINVCKINEPTVDKFLAWHTENPKVWEMFEGEALRLIAEGQKEWGAKSLAEWIRRERARREGGQFRDYAINNNYPAYYGRVFVWVYPEYKGFFEERELRGLRRVA